MHLWHMSLETICSIGFSFACVGIAFILQTLNKILYMYAKSQQVYIEPAHKLKSKTSKGKNVYWKHC